MFRTEERRSHFRTAIGLSELIYFSTVRQVRRTHRNAFVGLASNVMQTVIFVAAF